MTYWVWCVDFFPFCAGRLRWTWGQRKNPIETNHDHAMCVGLLARVLFLRHGFRGFPLGSADLHAENLLVLFAGHREDKNRV